MAAIEYVQGTEGHSSNWAKFFVRGLEEYVVTEEHPSNAQDKHHNWQCYVGIDIPPETVFTVFASSGNKRGTEKMQLLVCKTADALTLKHDGDYASFIEGNFDIEVIANGKTKVPRLLDWLEALKWDELSSAKRIKLLPVLKTAINKRGCKFPPQDEIDEALA